MARSGILVEGCQDRVAIICGKLLFEFVPGRGLFTITLADRAHILRDATLALRIRSRAVDSTCYPEVRWRVVDLSDNLGEGKAFIAYFGGKPELPCVTADFSFYEGKEILAVGVQVDNTTGHEFLLSELSPIFCRGKGGRLTFGRTRDCKALRSNWAALDGQPRLYSLGPGVAVDAPNSLLLHDASSGAALVSGIFEPARCLTSFHISSPEGEEGSLDFFVRQRPVVGGASAGEDDTGIVLRDNQSFSAGRIALVYDELPLSALEKYAQSLGMVNDVRRLERIPCGWSCRAQHSEGLTEQRILSYADFVARELKRYGLSDILIDAGWQALGGFSGGPWNPGESFPNGMKAVVDKVHAKGLRVGLWFRPLELDSMRLDPSSSFAKRLLNKEAGKFTREWGFDFVRIDFLDWDAFDRKDRFLPEDGSSTTNEAVRSALESIRKGLRSEAFLLGLDSAFATSLGIVQGAGIVRNVEAGRWQTVREEGVKAAALRYHLHNWLWVNDPGYLAIGAPATLGQARAWASLVALSGGCVFVGDSLASLSQKKISIIKRAVPPFGKAARPVDLLEKEQPQLWVIDVQKPFGKWHIVGLFNWDATLREIAECYRQAVQHNIATLRQNDLNEGVQRPPSVHRKIAPDNRLIRKENERIASVLKSSGIAQASLAFLQPVRKMRKSPRFRNLKLSFRKLGLESSVPYLVYDFWADAFLGEHRGSLTTLVKLAGCRILSFRPRLDHPQLLSTNRHVTQGGIELKDLRWDQNRCELTGRSELVGEDDYSLAIHVPRNYKFLEMTAECEEFRAETRPPGLVRLRLKNKRDKTVTWRAKFEKLL